MTNIGNVINYELVSADEDLQLTRIPSVRSVISSNFFF